MCRKFGNIHIVNSCFFIKEKKNPYSSGTEELIRSNTDQDQNSFIGQKTEYWWTTTLSENTKT